MRISARFLLIALAQAASALALATALVTAGGCGDSSFDRHGPDPNFFDGGGVSDAGASDANTDASADPDAQDGAPGIPPVFVGITPNTPSGEPGDIPPDPTLLDAALTTLAAGVRGAVLSRTWRTLETTAGQADLAAHVAFYRKYGVRVLFNLAFVNRLADGRPDDLAGLEWDSDTTLAALDLTIDQALQSFGKDLDTITFGRDIDLYIAAHPDQRDAIEAFVDHAATYTRAHPAAPAALRIGAALSFEGTTSPDTSFAALQGAGDAVVISYLPGYGGATTAPASEIANQLDQIILLAQGKPIILQSVGYPSDPAVGSSTDKQALFFDTFFEALLPRRTSFAWVNVRQLYDLDPAACDALTAAQGEPPDGPLSSYACSLGLITAAGDKKSAWLKVVEGLATFAYP